MAKSGNKTTKTKDKGTNNSYGARYNTADGWGSRELVLMFLFIIVIVFGLAISSYFTLGNFGTMQGACGSVEIPARGAASTHQQTRGALGSDAEPGSTSQVKLTDRSGEFEAEYQVPDGCYGGNSIIFYHFY